MKGMMKKTLILMAAALMCFLAYAGKVYADPEEQVTADGFKYKVNDDGVTVTVTGFVVPESYAPGQVLEIPDTVTVSGTDMKVTVIDRNAFRPLERNGLLGCKWSGLILPKYLEEIKDYAFFDNKYMTGELVIPNSVTVIGMSAFSSCEKFTGLALSNTLSVIGNNAFEGCTGFCGELKLPTTLTLIDRTRYGGQGKE